MKGNPANPCGQARAAGSNSGDEGSRTPVRLRACSGSSSSLLGARMVPSTRSSFRPVSSVFPEPASSIRAGSAIGAGYAETRTGCSARSRSNSTIPLAASDATDSCFAFTVAQIRTLGRSPDLGFRGSDIDNRSQTKQSSSYLEVAVGAEQHALFRLCSHDFESPVATSTQSELLLARVEVMELKCRDALVVAADSTSASGFLDEDLFVSAPSVYRPPCPASSADVLTSRRLLGGVEVLHESRHPVSHALSLHWFWSSDCQCPILPLQPDYRFLHVDTVSSPCCSDSTAPGGRTQERPSYAPGSLVPERR